MRKDSILQQYYYKKLPKYQDKGEVVLPPYPIPRSSFMGDEVIPNPIPKDEFIKRSKQSIPQAVDFWKNWYAGRQTLPQFKDVSERRLKLLEQPVDVQYLQPTQLMKENTVGRYIPETKKMELVDPLNEYVSKGSRDDIDRFNEFMSVATGIPVVGHELFHKLGYQAPQGDINTLTRYPHSPSFERTSKPIFAPPKQYGIPKEQYEYYALEQMIPSAKRNKRSEFPSEKTTIFHPEMEAGVAMLRMAENMDPTKTYTIEDVKPIIDKYSKYKQDNLKYDLPPEGYESQHNSWFINRMFQMLGNDPDKIAKYLNSVARTTQRKPLDFAKHGGLVKAQYGIPSARELANQNQSYSTDAALAAKMQADAQAARLKSKMLSAAKESYIAPARQSTPQEEQMRMIRNRTYQAQNAPYTRMNAQGDLSRAIPNVSMSGQPDVRTPEARWQKGSEHMMNALEAAGAMQGLGYLGRQGYNAARAALAESMESGLLSNTYKINPWRFKPNPEAYYHRSPNIENIVNRETGMLQGFGESEAGKQFTQNAIVKQSGINLQKGANSRLYFSKGTPLDYGRTNMILDKKTGKLIPGQGYPGPYVVEVEGVPMGASTKGRVPGVEPTRIGSYAVSRRPISANEAKYYKEDWLRGYREVPKPTRFTTTSKGLSTPTADELPEYLRPYIGRTEPEYSDAEKIWRSWFKGEAPPMPTKSAKPPVLSSATTSTSISAPGQRMDVTFGRAGDDVTRTSMEFPENADEYRKFLRQQQLKKEAGDILRREGLPNIRYSGSYQAPTNKLVWRDPNTGEIRHQLGAESYEGFKTPELFNLAKKDLSDYKRKYWQQLIDQRNASLNSARLLAEYGKQRKVPEYYVRNPKDLTRFLGELGEYANPSTQMYHRGKDLGEKLEDFVPMEKSHLYDKKDMYHILTPNKHGGIIEDNRGQWAHPGKNTRISSPNITMDGVPYPVLAKASNGQQQMMYPNQDYYFPGAEYVDEYPMMQRGGRAPIYTEDPRKVQAYNDSLSLYKLGEAELKRFFNGNLGESRGKIRNIQDLSKAIKTYTGSSFNNKLYNIDRDALNSNKNVQKISNIYNRTGILPTEFWANEGFLNYRFKKPVQPYTLQQQKPQAIVDSYVDNQGVTHESIGLVPRPKRGARTPIYTSNPNDPRLRAYNDSLNLYKENFNQLKSERDEAKFLKRIPFNSIRDNQYAKDFFERNDTWDTRSKGEVYPEKIKPIYFDINQIGNQTQHSAYYKKPVQPVEYKKEIPKFERIGKSRKPNLNLIGEELERTNVPLIPNRPYRVDYTDASGKKASAFFPSDKEGAEFMKQHNKELMENRQVSGAMEGYYDRLPKKQGGGMNRKGMRCPGPVCGPGRMDGEPTAVGNLLRNIGYGVGDFFGNIFTRKRNKKLKDKTIYIGNEVESAPPNFLFYGNSIPYEDWPDTWKQQPEQWTSKPISTGAPAPAASLITTTTTLFPSSQIIGAPRYDDAIVFNSPSGLKTTSLETSNVENMTYGSAEYGGPLVEYYKGRMTGPNMFQVGGFNLIPPAVTNPYIQKAISSITNFLMPSSSQSQELEQGKIPTKISNELLLKQAFKESQFNPKAVSPKGYKGLTQIGQDIIADYIKKTGVKNIDPFNPKHAKDIQEYAMNSLYNADFINKPNQSDQVRIAKTLAAYNWGRGNLSNFLNEKKKKGMDIYKSLDWMKDLPTETSDYINKILLNKSSDFNQQFQKSITNPTYKSIVSLYKEHGGQSNEGYYNYNYGVPEFEYGGPTRMNKFGYLEDAKAGGGEYHHGYYDQYGGDISIPQLPNMQKPLLQYYYNKIK